MVFERGLRWASVVVPVALATAFPAFGGERSSPPSAHRAGPTSARAELATQWPPGAGLPTARPAQARPDGPTVTEVLAALRDAGELDPAAHDLHRAAYLEARVVARRLTGRRRAELGGALVLLDDLAARGELTRARLPLLWATLAANRRTWTAVAEPAPGQRVGFPGSELVWQAYPGQGLQLQVLGSFGKLNGLLAAGREGRYDARAGRLVDELLALAVPRGGGIAWESPFRVGAGDPPWVSAMGQGTAVQALGRAAQRLGRPELLEVARSALGIFTVPPPVGVRVASGTGAHYLLYSSDPELRVLNGFLQSLIGLHDFAAASGDGRARALFEAGERAARDELPRHDTGAWSLYSLGRVSRESDLGYHLLVRDFLAGLCRRGVGDLYCAARDRFTAYTREAPVLRLRTRRVRAGRTRAVSFGLSKRARVGVRIVRGGSPVLVRELGSVSYGRATFAWAVPRRVGRYTVVLTAHDLAGNAGSATAELVVARAPRRERP